MAHVKSRLLGNARVEHYCFYTTRLAEVMGDLSHDSVNRFLLRERYEPKDLFDEVSCHTNLVNETLRSLRVSIMSGLCQGKLLVPLTFEGGCNRQVFEKWCSQMLIPKLKPGQIIILDNATFHKSERITQLFEQAGCQLQYLPPHSPDLNEI